jgi:hypothetical protein
VITALGIAAMYLLAFWLLYRLARRRLERMGNGLLVGVLVWLVLEGEGAPAEQRLFALALVAAAFGAGFVALVRRPEDVVLGYKG